MMLRERRGVIKWRDVIRHIVPAPASYSPARRTSQSGASPSRQGCPFPLCISYKGIVCSNNFNGSRQRISFARRSEREISRECIQKRNRRAFSGTEIDAFLLFHSFNCSFVLLLFISHTISSFVIGMVFEILLSLNLLIVNYVSIIMFTNAEIYFPLIFVMQ